MEDQRACEWGEGTYAMHHSPAPAVLCTGALRVCWVQDTWEFIRERYVTWWRVCRGPRSLERPHLVWTRTCFKEDSVTLGNLMNKEPILLTALLMISQLLAEYLWAPLTAATSLNISSHPTESPLFWLTLMGKASNKRIPPPKKPPSYRCFSKALYSTVQNSQDIESTTYHRWRSGILKCSVHTQWSVIQTQKEWNLGTFRNVNKPEGHVVELNKSSTEREMPPNP